MIETASAQFTPAFLNNASYWTTPKSEFDFYNAELRIDGQPRSCELLMIFTPKFVDSSLLGQTDNSKRPGPVPVMQMEQMVTAPRGIVWEQRSISALWRLDFMSLAQLSTVTTDGFGNVVKMIVERRANASVSWVWSCQDTSGGSDLSQAELPSGPVLVYDELPLRVRTLDFARASGEATVQLVPALESVQTGGISFRPARVSWKSADRTIEVDVTHADGKDHFVLDRDFPFLLREWQMADGSHLKMKNSLRLDYRDYLKNGDRERALKDPMLRHPD